jgi:hypothetical protein
MVDLAFELRAAFLTAAMLAGLVGFMEIGRRVGVRRRARELARAEPEGAVVDTAVFALLGLLIAFSFSGALGRFDRRRTLVADEANAIGAAYRHLDLLPAGSQPALRALFRRYVESRLAYYRKFTEADEAGAERERSFALQDLIWSQATAAARLEGNSAVLNLVGAGIDAMIKAEADRIAATYQHPPAAIYGMLLAVSFVAAFLAGHSTAGNPRNWSRVLIFAASLALAVFVIVNLEYPRFGVIRFGVADQPLLEALGRMH